MPTYAIVQTGGKQYRVQPGDLIDVERLTQEIGATVELEDVRLLSADDSLTLGNPQVSGARVVAEVTEQLRGPKIVIGKYKAKTRYRRKTGHRQSYTRLRIGSILVNGEIRAEVAEPPARSEGAPEGR